MAYTWIQGVNYTPKKCNFNPSEVSRIMRELKEELAVVVPNKFHRKTYVLNEARRFGVKSGKWMFGASKKNHDEIVKKFKELAAEGKIGLMKYVSPSEKTNPFYIVYVEDFDDEKEVRSTFELLIDEFGTNYSFYFKPDIYTYMDIYSCDRELLIPYIYFSNEHRYIEVI